MANDPNLALFTLLAIAPSSTYPLSGSRTNVAVKIVNPSARPTLVISSFTRSWGGLDPTKIIHNQSDEQSLFPPWKRNFAVKIQTPPFGTIFLRSVFNRQWNGIGGTGYLPSFPQWDRKVTTWPMAH